MNKYFEEITSTMYSYSVVKFNAITRSGKQKSFKSQFKKKLRVLWEFVAADKGKRGKTGSLLSKANKF